MPARQVVGSAMAAAVVLTTTSLFTAADAQAQGVVTYGPNQFHVERAQGHDGADGISIPADQCGAPTDGEAGARGAAVPLANGQSTLTYAPNDPQAIFNGDIAVVGSAGGDGGNGGSDWVDNGCNNNGANGGAGGAGGTVSLTVNPGEDAPAEGYMVGNSAIIAYSYGGNGGTGGDARYKKRSGGDGGVGGNGGQITVVNNVALDITGTSSTQGSATAAGIVAQSAGGAGGEGGFVHNSDSHASGGSGASGGAGGWVKVTNNAAIHTAGGIAIVAQSIGGFGGDAGSTHSGYGGAGGGGGNGGAVTLTNSGAIAVGSPGLPVCTDTMKYGCNASGVAGLAAQSVGGGGGDAGADAGLHALGADGGHAGHGGNVQVVNSGTVDIFTSASNGVFAQSIGGGGGKGGMAFGSGGSTTAIGGSGGDGGSGGMVQVYNNNAVCTGAACLSGQLTPDNSTAGGAAGIFAQSVGGGGGQGGFAQAKSKSFFGGSAHATGGSGGSGGDGGEIAVTNLGDISTAEINSAGILAQSIGGGGGSGGGALSLAAAYAGGAVSISTGGSGGSGGDGGYIAVNCGAYGVGATSHVCNTLDEFMHADAVQPGTTIMTGGDHSAGILAQSVGGGGGSGGYAVSLSADLTGAMSLSFGGSGGDGGKGGDVFASTNGSSISTLGESAPGIIAQSVGGGGGSGGASISVAAGGTAALGLALGGSGGTGNSGGNISAFNPGGEIDTAGDNSPGLLAQSVGGGGGQGGAAITLAASLQASVGLSLGGSGGSGGKGNWVTVYNQSSQNDPSYGSGAITTTGYNSSAILAQSIGGGGGQGGFALAGSLALSGSGAAAGIAIGGSGGSGNDGNNVNINNYGSLTTKGGGAAAVLAQSIGGGGGNGGGAIALGLAGAGAIAVGAGGIGGSGGIGGNVSVRNKGTINVIAPDNGYAGNAPGILAQSIGGGGGTGGFAAAGALALGGAASVAVGGGGGNGGNAQTVTIDTFADISVAGPMSSGMVGQSMGGNGGTGGFAIAGAGSQSFTVSAAVGGGGGAGGKGGDVALGLREQGTTISTSGDQSVGMLAQSLGGSGGAGGWAFSDSIGGNARASVALGGSGGGNGLAGNVSAITEAGTLLNTNGKLAPGILAQSIGGSGGFGGFTAADSGSHTLTATVELGNSGGDATPGIIRVNNAADIDTVGDLSAGIVAQSIGGAGGTGGFATSSHSGQIYNATFSLRSYGNGGGNGQAVTVGQSGALATHGAGSTGILAQSVGGGGGNGGATASMDGQGRSATAAFNLGNSSSARGNGGSATVCGTLSDNGSCTGVLSGGLATEGDAAIGAIAQSIGGGGGTAVSVASAESAGSTGDYSNAATDADPFTAKATTSNGYAMAAALGTAGANGGGDGGYAKASIGATIATQGDMATAIMAQSVGGGGGASLSGMTNANSGTFAANIHLGGVSNYGGKGGTAHAGTAMGSAISTQGDLAYGVLVQSVGGGGGLAQSSSATTAGGGIGRSYQTLGSTGGAHDENGSTVSVNNFATIATQGVGSTGLIAQSVGGGGGVAGVVQSSAATGWVESNMTLGAGGYASGNGGAVTVTASFDANSYAASWSDLLKAFGTDTAASTEHFINQGIKQSRYTNLFNVGQYLANYSDIEQAFGGDPSGATRHYITNGYKEGRTSARLPGAEAAPMPLTGIITTTGDQATGLLAQSIGGGGGVATFDNIRAGDNNDNAAARYTLGAVSPAASGTGGPVQVIMGTGAGHTPSIVSTAGQNASAILAQSIGGGGGLATYTTSGVASSKYIAVDATLGGVAHGHNEGGTVGVYVGQATIDTRGVNSFGIAAQSIGGGGGIATLAVHGSADLHLNAHLGEADSDNNGGWAISNAVTVSSAADIHTHGNGSSGIVAQSISAGGGIVGFNPNKWLSSNATISMGAMGGKGGQAAANVTVNSYGSITTDTLMSHGIVAQSIAGGGGMSTGRPNEVILGGRHNGDGGSVVVNSYDAITTSGTTSIGIVAQSIGGGGGLAATTGTATLGGSENGSDAGAVTVTSNAPITTSGTNAVGILAQSVGGGGGAALSFGNGVPTTLLWGGGNASDVTVNVNAPITTTGSGADGVVAQSVSGGGGLVMNGTSMNLVTSHGNGRSGVVYVNVAPHISIMTGGTNATAIKTMSSTDPVINVGEGASVVGGDGGAAIQSDSPLTQITNAGTISTVSGTGMAIRSLSGDTTVINSGTLRGAISLAAGGANIVQNAKSGTILAGASLDLGGGTLHNAGILQAGGATPGTVTINGSFTQEDTASLVVRLDQKGGTADSFNITGSAKLAGTLRPSLLSSDKVAPGTLLKTIVSAAGGVDISQLKISGESAILSYALTSENGQVKLATKVDFTPGAISRDGAIIGQLIGNAQRDGLSHFGQVMPTLLALREAKDLDQAYYNLSGGGLSAASAAANQMSTAFMSQLLNPNMEHDGEAKDWSGWARFFGGSRDTSAAAPVGAGDISTAQQAIAIGFDVRGEEGSLFGVAFSTGSTRFSSANGVRGDGDVHQAGLYGTARFGAGYVAGTAIVGWHNLVTRRVLPLLDIDTTGHVRGVSLGSRVEAGYRFGLAKFSLTPYAAIQAQRFNTPRFSENYGAGANHAALRYDARSVTDFRMEAGASAGAALALGRDKTLAVGARAAWLHHWSSNPDMAASFAGLPQASFRVGATPPVADAALLSAGAELRLGSGLSLGARFEGEFADRLQGYTGAATLRYRWR